MFEVEEGKVKLMGMNTRTEMHGEELRVAVDLNFKWETGNGCLALFAPALRSCLYQRDTPDLVDPVDPNEESLRSLRFAPLGVLKWDAGELVGAGLRFHYGTSEKSHIVFDDVNVAKYHLECKEGGTVIVSFQAQVRPNEKQVGQLANLLQIRDVVISVTPPGSES